MTLSKPQRPKAEQNGKSSAALSRRRGILLCVIASLLFIGLAPGEASSGKKRMQFERWEADRPSPTGQTVVADCNPAETDDAETWAEARASFTLIERGGRSEMTFAVLNARPHTLYTVWARLIGEDSEGVPYGGSPLTGIPVTPLVASDELPEQLAATLPNPGSDQLSNGFRTNGNGNGNLTLRVDFPVSSGAYPFQRFPNFDELKTDIALTNPGNIARLNGQPASIKPVAITDGSQAPATILIASHCVDDTGHGLLPGPHENWFTWSLD